MGAAIYLLRNDGALIGMAAQPYDSGQLLQRLLADHPDLVAGAQMGSITVSLGQETTHPG
jgi:hypothetical protein